MSVTCHRARLIMQAPGRWISNGFVALSKGRILAVERMGKKAPDGEVVDHGDGILMPTLVNAHTHLTLSALKGRVNSTGGFLAWVECLIQERAGLSLQEAMREAREAIQALRQGGAGLVGEFGPLFPIQEDLANLGLEGVVWQEWLGGDREVPQPSQDYPGIVLSLAGHAPHTTSPALLQRLKALCSASGLPFCMHLAESAEEVEFLEKGSGRWARFLESRQVDFRDWDCFGLSPVGLAYRLGLLDSGTLLVHLIQVTDQEVELLAGSGVRVCVCPRSNWRLHRALPPLEKFLKAGLEPCLGTDSLASVDSLSMFDEMRFVAREFPHLEPSRILEMATLNGAKALGRSDLGSLCQGYGAKMLYVEMAPPDPRKAQERLLSDPPPVVRPVGWDWPAPGSTPGGSPE